MTVDRGNSMIQKGFDSQNAQQHSEEEIQHVTVATVFKCPVADDILRDEPNVLKEGVKSPEIKMEIEHISQYVLIDSGSVVSCISQEFYDRVKTSNDNIPVFPVTGMRVVGAVGTRSTKIIEQVLLKFAAQDYEEDIVCIVVPGLLQSVILGADWCFNNGARCLFDEHRLELQVESGKRISFPFHEQEMVEHNRIAALTVDKEETAFVTLSAVERNAAVKHGVLHQIQTIPVQNVNVDIGVDIVPDYVIRSTVDDIPMLNTTQKTEIGNLLITNRELFSNKPGLTDVYVHKIEMAYPQAFVQKTYPVPFAHREAVRKQIEKMVEWGVIERAPTQYINPLVTVIKKNGEVRLCLDARKLNQCIVQDRESPTSPDEILQRFEKIAFMSTIDLTSSYWQVPLRKKDRAFTGFLHESRSYQFCVMPYGLSTAVGGFTRLMDRVLGPEVASFTTAYIDDLLITSSCWTDHVEHLQIVFAKLKQAGLTVNFKKSSFCKDKVQFLGHILTPQGILTDPEKIKAIQEFPVPRNIRHLRSFIGLVNYYVKFCERYSDSIAPLLVLLKKHARWSWTSDMQAAFEGVKAKFLGVVMLHHPVPYLRYYVQADSSGYGLGAQLYQIIDGTISVIAFASRILKPAERAYSTTEREALAIVFALMKWRTYVLGSKLTILTDHKALSFLLKCRLLNNRLTRWTLILQEYAFDIRYIKGAENCAADALSRYPVATEIEPHNLGGITDIVIAKITIELDQSIVADLKDLGHKQKEDTHLRPIVDYLAGASTGVASRRVVAQAKEHIIYEGVLFRRRDRTAAYKACVPLIVLHKLIVSYHVTLGHCGPKKCFEALRDTFYFPNMRRVVSRVLAPCILCQRSKVTNKNYCGMMQNILPTAPGQLIAVDLYGPLPRTRGSFCHIFVMLDVFTKYVKLYPLRVPKTSIILRHVADYVTTVGKPLKILADHGSQFCSHQWYDTLKSQGIQPGHSSIRHPQSNPSERVMRELGRVFRTFCHNKHTTWIDLVPKINVWFNLVTHDATGFTPLELQFGTKPKHELAALLKLPPNVVVTSQEVKVGLANERLQSRAKARKEAHDAHKTFTTYNIGDKVWLKALHLSNAIQKEIKKFFLLYDGPFVVNKLVGNNAYELVSPVDGTLRGTFNVIHLKPFIAE